MNCKCPCNTAPTTDEDARTYALEQIEAAQAETTEAVTRAERAEATAERYGRTIDKLQARIEELESMTAREHLDAAWSAAHVPADGTIPEGAEFIVREANGMTSGPWTEAGVVYARIGDAERRLIDPPTRTRPEGAEEYQRIIADRVAGDLPDDVIRALADDVAEKAGETVLWSGEDGEER